MLAEVNEAGTDLVEADVVDLVGGLGCGLVALVRVCFCHDAKGSGESRHSRRVREREQSVYGVFMFANDNLVLVTVGAFWEEHTDAILSRVRPRTRSGYEVAWRRRVGPSFAHRPLAEVTTFEVEEVMAGWDVSRSTKADGRACLSAIMRAAVKARLIPVNPCLGAELPRDTDRDPSGRALTLGEVGALLEELEGKAPAWRRFVLCMLFTGMRLGEVAGLLVSDCDLAAGFIRVNRTASPGYRGELNVGPTKSGRSRMVPIPAQLVPVLREACEGKGSHDLAFPGPLGGYVNSQNLRRGLGWTELRERVKTFPPGERPLKPHDMRHTAATTLFLAGSSAPDVQAIMGHSSLQVTQIYANTKADAARRAVPLLSDYYARIEVTPKGGDPAPSSPSLQGF